jgi:hypothetical protein
MNNVDVKVVGDKLTIQIDISKTAIDMAKPSATGKTWLVASTGGALPLEAKHCQSLSIALNVMAKK